MPRSSIDKSVRRSLLDTRRMIIEAEKADCNEAETRRRIERIFETLMGYDAFKHLSRERAIRGAGETEHVDFAIQLEQGEDAKPIIMVEIKRVNVNLAPKHLKQVSSYAINAGSEWILLTNSRDWKLYHVSFGKPPITKLIRSWNVVTGELPHLAQSFELVSYKSVKKGKLEDLWHKTNVLHPRNLLQAILSESSMRILRRDLKKEYGIQLTPEEIVAGMRRMLNEAALNELESIKISFPQKKKRVRPAKTEETTPGFQVEPESQEGIETATSNITPEQPSTDDLERTDEETT